MELLYVWVESYGNIKRQGFNFGPNYDFEVKEENGEYILVDNFETSGKKKQPENFFGDNISNITAVVGKNGSGKSTILDFIATSFAIWDGTENQLQGHKSVFVIGNDKEIIVVYFLGFEVVLNTTICKKDNVKNRVIGSIGDNTYRLFTIIDSLGQEHSKYKFQIISYSDIVLSYYRDRQNQYIHTNNFINISSSVLINNKNNNDKIDKIKSYRNNNFTTLIKFFKDNYETFSLFKLPRKIYINLNENMIFNKIGGFREEHQLYRHSNLFIKISEKISSLNLNLKNKEDFKLQFVYLFSLSFLRNNCFIRYGTKTLYMEIKEDSFEDNDELLIELFSLFDKLESLFVERLDIVNEVEKIGERHGRDYKKIKSLLSAEEQSIIEKFNVINKIENHDKMFISNEINSMHNAIEGKKSIVVQIEKIKNARNFLEELLIKIEKSFSKYGYFLIDLGSDNSYIDMKDFKELIENMSLYGDGILLYQFDVSLSSGEEKMLNIFSRFYNLIQIQKKGNNQNILIVLDEPDIYLHLEWQRIFLSYFNNYIKSLFSKDKNIQIILTSHSPFVASDLPRENVIMLDVYNEKDKETKKDEKTKESEQEIGNCKVVKDKNIKTFGANIFDLYSNAFFIESSFGEFAKGKIKEVVRWLEYTEDKNTKERTYINEKEINKEQIEYILNSIGEPLVKNKLQKMYDEYKESKVLDKDKKNLLEKFKKLSLEEQLAIYEEHINGDKK